MLISLFANHANYFRTRGKKIDRFSSAPPFPIPSERLFSLKNIAFNISERSRSLAPPKRYLKYLVSLEEANKQAFERIDVVKILKF